MSFMEVNYERRTVSKKWLKFILLLSIGYKSYNYVFLTRKIFLKRGIPHSVPGQGIRRDIMRSRPCILRLMRDS